LNWLCFADVVGCNTEQDEIAKFIEKYTSSPHQDDVSVSKLRKIIPIFLKKNYPQEYGQVSRKGELENIWCNLGHLLC